MIYRYDVSSQFNKRVGHKQLQEKRKREEMERDEAALLLHAAPAGPTRHSFFCAH